ncbi:MAG: Holliday junction branch migration protein RuvA [Bacteroidales bacterium]|nr:Holliday junction branch migration protein RuvA [Bacteroidales bacterium]
MFNYIQGKIDEATPAYAVIDCNGVGYLLEISVNTYTQIKDLNEVRLLVHEVIREDAHLLFGFYDESERTMFRLLLGVNGVGVATARIMLSTLTVQELHDAIVQQNARTVQAVKGIGAKTAQRIILELHDKVGESLSVDSSSLPELATTNQRLNEASAALQMLGFAKPTVEKTIATLGKQMPDASVEDLIKQALHMMS